MKLVLGLIYIFVIVAVAVSMTVLLLKGNGERYNKHYLACQGSVVIWCISQILLLLSETKAELHFSYLFGNLGICFVGAFLYYFAVGYTGVKPAGCIHMLPFVLSLGHYLLVFSNQWHHLYYKEFSVDNIVHGQFFYTNVVLTYVYVIVVAGLLYRHMEGGEKGRLLVTASVLVPVVFNVIYLTGIIRPGFDITPLGFAVSVILIMFATVKYQFMDLKRELAITGEKLLLEKERNRIAQQVHDTTGHTLTMISSYMKLAAVSNDKKENDKVAQYLKEAKELSNRGIKELRESINRLRKETSYEMVTQGIMQLTDQVREIPVEVTVQGEDSERYSHLTGILYDCVRESVTNSLKYAEASKMEIVVRFSENAVELVIGDDGKGCGEIRENNGLRGIRERIERANGTVKFISGDGEGFLTRIKVPV